MLEEDIRLFYNVLGEDGELLGETPLEFSILHKAVRIVVGREFYDRQERGECPCEGK